MLDEADEMLDLGFREDLETLLGAAPAARRTLLLSATLPPEIRSLARRFQRDALAIDPRKAAAARRRRAARGGGARRHHLRRAPDRGRRSPGRGGEPAARVGRCARAIVFCTTRDAVGALHRELVSRGFAATAISGERAQAERDRALDQVRQGEARILVATNVAARGLHLPDVDLIVHADLPLNAESLTHRSGRTGRAGRKGTAVVIASLAERRKAERLLAAANVRVPWTAPPSGKQIAAAARAQLLESLLAESPPADGDGDARRRRRRRADDDADDLLAPLSRQALLGRSRAAPARARAGSLAGRRDAVAGRAAVGREQQPLRAAVAASRAPRRRSPGDISRDGVMFRVNLGGKDQADPRWLLPLICRRGGVTRREVGAIRIGPQETVFEIAGDAAADFALAASQTDPRAPHVRVERLDGGGDGGGGGGGGLRWWRRRLRGVGSGGGGGGFDWRRLRRWRWRRLRTRPWRRRR